MSARLGRFRIAAVGLLTGSLFGIVGSVSFVAACVRDDRMGWSALTDRELLPYWIAGAVAGAVNGGIGAWVGRVGNRRIAPVAWVPLVLLLHPLAICMGQSSDSKSWGGDLCVVVFGGLFVWVAGRVGQEIGAWRLPA